LGDRHRKAALRNPLADLYYADSATVAAMAQLEQAVAIFAEIGAEIGAEAGPENAKIGTLSAW